MVLIRENPRPVKRISHPRDPRPVKRIGDPRDPRPVKIGDPRDPRPVKRISDPRDPRPVKDQRDPRDPRPVKWISHPRDPRPVKRISDPRDPRPVKTDPRFAPVKAFGVLQRWGLTTLGEVAALPAEAFSARLGQAGLALQRMARGIDAGPLVPDPDVPRFLERIELEWPIDGLEPLAFVLARLLEPLSSALERADRAAAAIHLELRLVDRTAHTRVLQLPAAMRDPKVLRTLLVLDLESHPPPAAIDIVAIEIDPAPGRVLQYSLLERARPSAETLATLTARLDALVGESRCGPARSSSIPTDRMRSRCAGLRRMSAAARRRERSRHPRPRLDRPCCGDSVRPSPSGWPSNAAVPAYRSSIGEGCPAATSSSARAPGGRRGRGGKAQGKATAGIAMNGMSPSATDRCAGCFRHGTEPRNGFSTGSLIEWAIELAIERALPSRSVARSDVNDSVVSGAISPCISNCTRLPRFPFSTARRCRKRSSSAPRRSAIRRWRSSIATASTAFRDFIRRPHAPG